MAVNVTKLIGSKASRLMAMQTGTNLQLRFSSQMGCEKDCYTNRCGLRRFKQPPCKPCGDPSNPCEPCSKDPLNSCTSWTPQKKLNKFTYAFRKKDNFDECCEMGHLSRPPCSDTVRFGYKLHVQKTPWEMILHPSECCPPCLPDPPRFDELYYKIRQMCEKEYFPTWAECPKPRIIPKMVCCYDKEPIEVPRRIRCKAPITACPLPEDALNRKLLVCKVGGDPNCVKVFTPCCCPARNPPKCLRIRQPICTGRLPVPAPAFSECCKPSTKPLRNTECYCHIIGPRCGYPPLPPKPLRTC